MGCSLGLTRSRRGAIHDGIKEDDSVEKKFSSNEVPLGQLLDQARTGQLQLPDFQRGWVWDDNHIASLLASISLSYPIGAVMTLETGNPDVRFRPRPLEGVILATPVEPEVLLLDGQQRATSLYAALRSGASVPTRDARGNDMLRNYYVDIRASLEPNGDREEAVVSVPADGLIKTFRGEVRVDVSTRDAEIASEMFPLAIVLDFAETMSWQLKYLNEGPGDYQNRLAVWTEFNTAVITAFVQYQVPTIELVRATPKEAVCQVFEKVNTGGVSLTVFELLTATYAADDFNLRDDWKARRARLHAHAVLEYVKETDFIQVVSLLATYARRQDYLDGQAGDESKAPAVSCKRRDVLRLPLEDYTRWADAATIALERVVPFLHSEHAFTARDIPYATQLVPLAAIYVVLGKDAEGHGVRSQLARWYWCGVLGEMYGGSTETRFGLDLPDVVGWIRNGQEEPRTVRDAQFQADRLVTLRTRNSAAYKGLYALQMKRGARDFRTGNTIDVHAYVDDAIDIHHIFPQRWCLENGIPDGYANSVVNKTAIDAHTNRRIGGNAPNKYLAAIEDQDKTHPDALDAILRSHDIDPVSLRQDDFASFFNLRFERLLKQVEAAMDKPVNRSQGKSESPYADPDQELQATTDGIAALIAAGEGKVVEFKSTGRKNLHTGDKDPRIEWSALKTVAGFMNVHGGTLLIGVADDGEIVGVEEDYAFLKARDRDHWEQWLTGAIATSMGKPAAAEVEVRFAELNGKTVARLDVGPAATPVFAKPPGGDGKPLYMVRLNNTTQELLGQDALAHQKKRWPQ